MLQSSASWKETYPGAVQGIMIMEGVSNPPQHDRLDALKAEFERSLRISYADFTRAMLQQIPTLKPYVEYYKRFDKSYHVLLQLESIVHKERSLPRVAALVEAMFLAELKNHLLTAGHDFDLLQQPFTLDVAVGSECYTQLNGREQTLKAGDMFVRDGEGIISSILYGPDQRTAITSSTKKILFVVYSPVGIGYERVKAHLEDLRQYTQLISPVAKVATLELFTA